MGIKIIDGAAASGRRVSIRALMLGAVFATLSAPSWAEEIVPNVPYRASVDVELSQLAGDPKDFNIPAQPLTSALTAFGRQSGLQVTVDGAVVRGIQAPAVSGTMSAADALTRLLAGSGLTYRLAGGTTVAIERPADGVTLLDPITVEGRAEQAYGPVTGYVAQRTATGTKTDTPLEEVPQSISVISGDEMQDRGVKNLATALQYSAGVNTGTYWNDTTSDPYSIRGFSALTLQDGQRAVNSGFDSVVEPWGAERIEVLRGPSAVLYGQSSVGGVVNIVSKRPTTERIRDVQLIGGSFEKKQIAIDIADAIDENKTLLFRVTALGRDSNATMEEIPDDRYFFAPSLTWKASEDTELTLLGKVQIDRSAFPLPLPTVGTLYDNPNGKIPFDNFIGEPDFDQNDKDTYSIGYDFRHQFDDTFAFHQVGRYFRSDVERREALMLALQGDNRTVTRRFESRPQESSIFSLDNNVTAKVEGDIYETEFLLGLDLMDTQFESLRYRGTGSSIDVYNPVYTGAVPQLSLIASSKQDQSQVGTYAQAQVKLYDHLALTFGGRYDWANLTTVNRLTDVTTKQRDEAFTGRVGAVYLFDNGLSPYVNYAESFEPVSGTDTNSNPFKPETGQQKEIGLRYKPVGYNAQITVSAFDITRQNVTTTAPSGTGSVQTGEVQSKGLELEILASLAKGLDLKGSYTLADAEVTESNGTDLGQRPAYEPKHMASMWLDYTLQSGAAKGLGFGSGVRYVGKTYSSDGSIKIPAFALMDATIHYQLEQFDLRLNVTNLFDKQYVSRCFTSFCYTGEQRAAVLSMNYSW